MVGSKACRRVLAFQSLSAERITTMDEQSKTRIEYSRQALPNSAKMSVGFFVEFRDYDLVERSPFLCLSNPRGFPVR